MFAVVVATFARRLKRDWRSRRRGCTAKERNRGNRDCYRPSHSRDFYPKGCLFGMPISVLVFSETNGHKCVAESSQLDMNLSLRNLQQALSIRRQIDALEKSL